MKSIHKTRAELARSGQTDEQRVELDPPVPLQDLGFGPANPLPRRLHGPHQVIFPATIAADGERGVTVFAELDEAGEAVAVMLRPDDMRTDP